MSETESIDLSSILSSMKLDSEFNDATPMVAENFTQIKEDVKDEDRFLSGLASLLLNIDTSSGRIDKAAIYDTIATIDDMVNDQINEVLHNDSFKALETNWRSLENQVNNTNFKANIMIDVLDVAKEELAEDFEDNSVDITGSELFKKVYVSEYDQYGGKPIGSIVGYYDFEHTPADEFWLRVMGKIAAASHAPFISNISPKFFDCDTIEELSTIKDLDGLLGHPKYGSWNKLRDSEEAAYLALTLPKFILRLPYSPESNPCGNLEFTEATTAEDNSGYLWGWAASLLAQNMAKSFETSGWCQYLRGPKGGGLVSGLPVHTFNTRGEDEIKVPVEIAIPDYRELEFANNGFIPLIYRKGSADACFFSCQSIKKAKAFKDAKDSENAQLVCNLSYTLSITRIAHYVKCIMRDNIGSSADAPYIASSLERWINRFVTTVVNPDDLTLRYYPFKAANVEVVEQEGMIGWYSCSIGILPHIQFEGMDVELRLDSRL
jgi:type VI secretion system protein ImpC